MILKCIIVDDEPNARLLLKGLIETFFFADLEVIGEADGLQELINLLKTRKPDVVFLDLEMKGSFGFDLFSTLEKREFEVVITSAHAQYALKAFEFGIADYLVKPISPSVLKRSIERVSQIVTKQKEPQILLHTQEGQLPVVISKIIRIEAERNYSRVIGTFGKPIFISKNLGHFESALKDHDFIRVHHSHLVSKGHIFRVLKAENFIEMSNGHLIPFSREKRKKLTILGDI